MSKFSILVKQLYKQKVRAKSFWLMLVLYIGAISAILFWNDIKELLFSSEPDEIAIVNETDYDMTAFFKNDDDTNWTFLEAYDDDVKKQLENEKFLALMHFTEQDNQLAANIVSFTPLQLNDQQYLASSIQSVGQMFAMSKLNLTDEQANALLNAVPTIESTILNEEVEGGKSTDEKEAGVWVSYIIGFVIYFFITSYLSMITTDVASEKGSRALEMLLVTVKPEIHFRAKLAGVFLVAFTQIGIMIAFILAILRFTDGGSKWDMVAGIVNDLSISYVFYVLAFLLFTIFLFLIIGALFGSLVSKVEEAGQVMMPAIMITLIGFYVLISGLSNPDTMLIKVFSYIPFTSGMVMPLRIGATDIAMIEPIISLAVLVLSVLILYFVSITFYKRSVLTYSTGGIIQKIKTVLKVTT